MLLNTPYTLPYDHEFPPNGVLVGDLRSPVSVTADAITERCANESRSGTVPHRTATWTPHRSFISRSFQHHTQHARGAKQADDG